MGIATNNLRKIVDVPTWEWSRFAPVATGAISCTCGDAERYIYYFSTTFWRYDTVSDTWQQLQTPPTVPLIGVTMKYGPKQGYYGDVLSATSTSITIAGLDGEILKNKTLRIMSGTGVGQEMTITSIGDNTILDHGIATTATSALITDTTKRWQVNQYAGYQVRTVFGAGNSQVRKVLYNDSNTLYFYDANFQQIERWNNNPFSIVAPYATPGAVAGSQTNYYIESTVITVPTMSPVPDKSSSFKIIGGGIWLFGGFGTVGMLHYYDILSDSWTYKTALGGNSLAALTTDFSLEKIVETTPFLSGRTATSGSARTITCVSDTYTVDAFSNYMIRIKSGTGMGQRERIVGNTVNTFEIARPWLIPPDNTSVFEIIGDIDSMLLVGNGQASVYKYLVDEDIWHVGNYVDSGVAANITVTYSGQTPFGVTSITRNTGGITVLNPTPTAGGTGYTVGDTFNITTGGTVGKGRVTGVNGGVVTSVELISAGLTYTPGASKATTIITGSGNNGLTVNITSVGTVGRVVLAQNHNLYLQDLITITGCNESAWNGLVRVLSVDSASTFDILATATLTAVASFTNSTILIVDPTKNWVINEHVGKIITLYGASYTPATTQTRRITSNTSTTITVATIVTATVASRYVIVQPEAFGRDEQWKSVGKGSTGRSISGTTISLTDNSKSWNSNQWINYKFRIIAGTGVGSEITITGNTNNTLQFTLQSFTPDDSTKYRIMDTFGTATGTFAATTLADSTKNWTVNQWVGKRLRITAGTGQGAETVIASNTSNTLTFTTIVSVTDATTNYTILGVPAKGVGIELVWIYGTTKTEERGRYFLCARGSGSNVFDRYDIVNNIWDLAIMMQPQTEIYTTGTMYSYDGEDKLIIHRGDAAATLRTFALDVNKFTIENIGQPPYAHGTPTIGNRMEYFKTVDGIKYIYIMRHTGTEMWRVMWWY